MFSSCILAAFLLANSTAVEKTGIERLLEGNQRYMHDKLEHPNRTPIRRLAVVSKQEPFATIVGCSDSRVSPEIIFDQGVGDLFVIRVAGNVIGPLELDSIEYSVIYLHSSVILVLGHQNCGAVQAVVQGNTRDIQYIADMIDPTVEAVRKANPKNLLEASIKANAIAMRDNLLRMPVIRRFVSDGKLKVYAGYYHLETGEVEILNNQ